MAYDFSPLKKKAKEINDWLAKEFAMIRTGRATPVLLDGVLVESYGARVPLRQVGSIVVEGARTLKVGLWDKSQLKAAETAIAAANLGVSVSTDGDGLRITFPELTADKRKILLQLAHEKTEEARISLRQERERVWQDIQAREKAKVFGEDDKFRLKDGLQKIIDGENKKLDEMKSRKEAEIKA